MFCWLLLLLVKIDAAIFEVNMTNHSQDITKKQFQQQLVVPPHKQTLLRNMYMKENYLTYFLKRNIVDNRKFQ